MNTEQVKTIIVWALAGIVLGLLILAALSQVAGCASSPQIVYIGTEPTIYATDQAALVPEPADPVWFDWQAPLNTEGFNFPADPDTPPGL